MKKSVKKLMAAALSALLLLSSLVFPATAADSATGNNTARYTQKVVAVVYDDSSSMMHDPIREPAARYSLEMLMALLDERDKMVIVPMNAAGNGIPVDLAAPNRDAELDRILAMSQLRSKTGQGTPPGSMGRAIDQLKSNGLKSSNELWASEQDKEYWLVILTDGGFDAMAGCISQADTIAHFIKDYPTLHTVYVGFGNGAVDLSSGIYKKTMEPYQFTPYITAENGLAAVIQNISNQMSGRYPLGTSDYSVSGNKVTINLDKAGSTLSAISSASISLIAQDCGATVKSATYNGKSMPVAKPSVIVPESLLGMKAGFACEVAGEPFFKGGQLVFEFTAPVNPDKLSIFAEPALSISYYIECMVNSQWQRVDMQYINENRTPGDEIRVGYEVREQANGDLVDLEKTFGATTSSVTYAQTKYSMGQNIPLKAGVHELNIEVSVMDGAYILRDSDTCSIEDNPNNYRVTVDPEETITGTSAKAVYTVYVNDKPATKDILKDYTYKATATDDNGNVTDLPTTMGEDGRVTAVLNVKQGAYGIYTVNFDVRSPYNITRSKTHDVKYYPPALTLTISGSDRLSLKQHDLTSNTTPFSFELFADGTPFTFDQRMITYHLLVDGVDVSSAATINGNRLTYVPHSDNLGAIVNSEGDKDVVLTVQSNGDPSIQDTAKATLSIIKTVFTVEALDYGNNTIDRFGLKETDAAAYFAIRRDGTPLPAAELQAILDNQELIITDPGQFSWMFWLPCGLEYSVVDAGGIPAIAAKVVCDMPSYFNWHFSAFIFKKAAPVTAMYADSSDTADLEFEKSNSVTHVVRITVLLLQIHLIFWLLGFLLHSKLCLPTGAFVVFLPNPYIVPVNNTGLKRFLWHFQRLLVPFCILPQRPPKIPCEGIKLGHSLKNGFFYKFTGDGFVFNAVCAAVAVAPVTTPVRLGDLTLPPDVEAEEYLDAFSAGVNSLTSELLRVTETNWLASCADPDGYIILSTVSFIQF